jgi:hypothetical protein
MGPIVHAYSIAKRGRLIISTHAARVAYSSSQNLPGGSDLLLIGSTREPRAHGRRVPASAPPMPCAALGTGKQFARVPPPGVKNQRTDEESKT